MVLFLAGRFAVMVLFWRPGRHGFILAGWPAIMVLFWRPGCHGFIHGFIVFDLLFRSSTLIPIIILNVRIIQVRTGGVRNMLLHPLQKHMGYQEECK